MAKLMRLDPGGSYMEEEVGLSIAQAKELAVRRAVGEPPGCCWCVGVEEGEEQKEQTERIN